jgi:IclR family acetate operon transcriptional repressor
MPAGRGMTAGNSSAERTLSVLGLLGDANDDLGVTEVAAALSLDKSVVHRILATLVELEFAEQHPHTRKYRIGVRAWEIGRKFTQRNSLEDLVVPRLREIVEETGGTGYVGALEGHDIVYLAVVHGSGAFRVHVEVGARVPAHGAALGKAILAELSADDRQEWLRTVKLTARTDRTIVSKAELERELDATKTRGFAINRGESRRGVGAVATAVVNEEGRPVVAVSIGFPLLEDFEEMWETLPPKLCGLARDIGRHAQPLAAGAGTN